MDKNMPGQQPYSNPEPPEEDFELGQMLGIILNAKGLIAAITVLVSLGALAYCLLATPVYRSDTLIQVTGKQSGMAGLEEFIGLDQSTSEADTEIEIIKSRSVIGAAVDQLHLNLVAGPEYFPLLGRAYVRQHAGAPADPPRKAPLGLSSYAWGGEAIQVERLAIPKSWEGINLGLIAGKGESFTLYSPEGVEVLTGQVGTTARSVDNQVEIFVTRLKARAATRFRISLLPVQSMIAALLRKIQVQEQGRSTGIIRVSMEGSNPVQLARTLQSIANIYLRQDIEKRSAEAEKTLQFLNQQLPILKTDLDASETLLNAYKSAKGSIDLTLDTQRILETAAELAGKLSELKMQKVTLAEKYTASHPAMQTLHLQQQQIEDQLAAINDQIKAMPAEIQEAVRLQRDVKVATELYLLLLNKAQEMKVVKAGTVGSVRIVDPAIVPRRPIKPQKSKILVLGLLLGLLGGIGVAFLKKALQTGIDDPSLVEAAVDIPVYATVPHSPKQDEIELALHKKKTSLADATLLAFVDKNDLALESLRSLRTSLQFAMLDAANNIISIGGPSPGIGKSFISANLAAILADGGKRILLIDADMRKGHLHEHFGLKRAAGLSELITGTISQAEAIHKTAHPQLDLLPSGIIPPNPSELLMHEHFREVLHDLAAEYDLVILDTSPVLAVTDAVIIAKLCGLNFLVLKAGVHPLREIQQAIKRFTQNNISPNGLIFNDLKPQVGIGHYGKYGYRYSYQYSYK